MAADLRRLSLLELSPHRAAAKTLAGQVAHFSGVRKVTLFGSAASGRALAGSDVDVAIELASRSPSLERRIHTQVSKLVDRTGVRLVPIFVTPRELVEDSQLTEGLAQGEVLYERNR